jgi:multidrug efflux pump subunit AcrA (membrane-fusion protein)
MANRLTSLIPAPYRELTPSRLWFVPPVLAGFLLLALTLILSPGASRKTESESALPVRVMVVSSSTINPKLKGFGEIRPLHRWQGIAQVAGKVAWRHPDLQVGATFSAGTRLFEIDELDYRVAESRARAQLNTATSAIDEITNRRLDLTRSIKIEQRAFEIATTEYQRNVELAGEGHISKFQLDSQEQQLLRREQTLQNLQAQFNLLPAQEHALKAQVNEAAATLDRATEDLRRIVIAMPFQGRITSMESEYNQFVPVGRTMVAAEGTRDVELLLEVPYEQLVSRFPTVMGKETTMSRPGNLLKARLTYKTNMGDMTWQGHVKRIDPGLNANNRSAQIYVGLDLDEDTMAPAINLYVQVEIIGPAMLDQIVLPRLALHAGSVLIADEENRLRRRPVTISFQEEDRVIIRQGLVNGERVILTDILFPAEGMLISPVIIEEYSSR